MLNGPVSHIPIPQFPADIRLSVCAHVTGGHGTYPLTFQLCAAAGDAVWQCRPAAPLDHPDPLPPQQLAFHELTVSVEKPDRYDMVLLWCCWPIRTDTTGSQRGASLFRNHAPLVAAGSCANGARSFRECLPTGSIQALTLAPHELNAVRILYLKQSTPTCSGRICRAVNM